VVEIENNVGRPEKYGKMKEKQVGRGKEDEEGREEEREEAGEDGECKVVDVGIVGSGLAGLTIAHLLSTHTNHPILEPSPTDSQSQSSPFPPQNQNDKGKNENKKKKIKFRVHLIEKSQSLGMDSASFTINDKDSKKSYRMDVPMRSFFPEYYPLLKSLYDFIGIRFAISDNSMSFYTVSDPSIPNQLQQSHSESNTSKKDNVSIPPKTNQQGLLNDGRSSDSRLPENTAPKALFSFSCYHLPWPIDNIVSFPDFPVTLAGLLDPMSLLRRLR
jgi:hypothetical protein